MEDIPLRFVVGSGLGNLSMTTYITAAFLFITIVSCFRFWSRRSLILEKGLENQPSELSYSANGGLNANRHAFPVLNQLFLPINYRLQSAAECQAKGYLRQLVGSQAVIVCFECKSIRKGERIEVDLGVVGHLMAQGNGSQFWAPAVVRSCKKWQGQSESLILELRLEQLPEWSKAALVRRVARV